MFIAPCLSPFAVCVWMGWGRFACCFLRVAWSFYPILGRFYEKSLKKLYKNFVQKPPFSRNLLPVDGIVSEKLKFHGCNFLQGPFLSGTKGSGTASGTLSGTTVNPYYIFIFIIIIIIVLNKYIKV